MYPVTVTTCWFRSGQLSGREGEGEFAIPGKEEEEREEEEKDFLSQSIFIYTGWSMEFWTSKREDSWIAALTHR